MVRDYKVNSFTLNTNLIPALRTNGIRFQYVNSVLDPIKIVVIYEGVNICRVEAIQDLCTDYCYKVTWVNPRDIICFPIKYKHFTVLIADIKKAINRLKIRGENNMNEKMYRVTDIRYQSTPWEMDKIDLTVNIVRSNCNFATREDYERIRDAIESIGNANENADNRSTNRLLDHHTLLRMFNKTFIKDVIFNDPATIVFWEDGTKTVVKAENEEFDPEKGLAMAITKKALGNNYGYYDTFKKYVGKYEKKQKKGDK